MDQTVCCRRIGCHCQPAHVLQAWFIYWLEDFGVALEDFFARDAPVCSFRLRVPVAQKIGVVFHHPATQSTFIGKAPSRRHKEPRNCLPWYSQVTDFKLGSRLGPSFPCKTFMVPGWSIPNAIPESPTRSLGELPTSKNSKYVLSPKKDRPV